MKLKILVGTMTSTADYVAQAIQMDCADLVDEIDVVLMDGQDISAFDDADALYLICTSTYGSGDVPDNARGLYDSLDETPRFLGHVRYGVIALGDSSYETFCEGGRLFDKALAARGARRIGEILCCDASSGDMPEEKAREWLEGWRDALAAEAGATA